MSSWASLGQKKTQIFTTSYLGGHDQPVPLVRNISALNGRHDDGAVDEDRVRQVLSHGDAVGVAELDEARPSKRLLRKLGVA